MSREQPPEGVVDDPRAFAAWFVDTHGYKRQPRQRQVDVLEAVIRDLFAARDRRRAES